MRRMKSDFQVHLPQLSGLTLLVEKSFYARVVQEAKTRQGEWDQVDNLFLHVPKCGGTSTIAALRTVDSRIFYSHEQILKFLRKGLSPPRTISLDHMLIDILLDSGLLSEMRLGQLNTFSIIRDPWARIMSSFRHHSERRIPSETTFGDYVGMVVGKQWSTRFKNEVGLSHAQPARFWLRPSTWKGPKTIFRLEELATLDAFLHNQIGVSGALPRLNVKARHDDSRCYCLTDERAGEFTNWFGSDFALGEYSTERVNAARCGLHR